MRLKVTIGVWAIEVDGEPPEVIAEVNRFYGLCTALVRANNDSQEQLAALTRASLDGATAGH